MCFSFLDEVYIKLILVLKTVLDRKKIQKFECNKIFDDLILEEKIQ